MDKIDILIEDSAEYLRRKGINVVDEEQAPKGTFAEQYIRDRPPIKSSPKDQANRAAKSERRRQRKAQAKLAEELADKKYRDTARECRQSERDTYQHALRAKDRKEQQRARERQGQETENQQEQHRRQRRRTG